MQFDFNSIWELNFYDNTRWKYERRYYRTYAGTLYIAYCQHEIVHTIISFFLIDITFNIPLNKVTKC